MPDEPALVEAILCGKPPLSRNKNFELLSSDTGKRARRRAGFLRSLARDIENARDSQGTVSLERGKFPRGTIRVVIHQLEHIRRAYLTADELALIVRAFPTAGKILRLDAEPATPTD